MVLEDFLFPQEVIRYQSKKEIHYADQKYVLYITNRRVIGHSRKGLILKKDRVFSVAIEEISDLKYDEQGLVRKKGVLQIQTATQTFDFAGKIEDVKVIWKEMQQYLNLSTAVGAPTAYSERPPTPGETSLPTEDNLETEEETIHTLKMRLAKGEISQDKYLKTKAILGD